MMSEEARTILVVGGGIAGTSAALHVAAAGHPALLIDEAPALGGSLILLDKTFPTDSCGVCFLSPNPPALCPFLECADNPSIQLRTLTTLQALEGDPGAFKATLVSVPRFVDPAFCTGCGRCADVCPVTVGAGVLGAAWLGESHKAIYQPCPQAVPLSYVVDPVACTRCGRCQIACLPNAINLDQQPETSEVDVAAVILAPGFGPNAATVRGAYGYGEYPNVVTGLEFERMLSTSSPSHGQPVRPSDGQPARRIAIIHCAGSRDLSCGVPYCSAACCMIAAKHASLSKQRSPEAVVTVYTMDVRAAGRGYERYLAGVRSRDGVTYRRSLISGVKLDPSTDDLHLQVAESGAVQVDVADLVVLEVGMVVPAALRALAESIEVRLQPSGFAETSGITPVETSRPGVYVAGAFAEPKDVPASIVESAAAAASALIAAGGMLHPEAASLETARSKSARGFYDVPVVGVFLDSHDAEIAPALDFRTLSEQLRRLPDVALVSLNATPAAIQQAVSQYSLTAIVVGQRSARRNEQHAELIEGIPVTRVALGAGDVFAHLTQPAVVPGKAYEMLRMAVEAARWAVPEAAQDALPDPHAVVLGSGPAGLSASRALSSLGVETHLIERADHLGGWRANLPNGAWLHELIASVEADPRITVHRSTVLSAFEQHPGQLRLTLAGPDGEQAITAGALVVATGAQEHRPAVYGLGDQASVMTLRDFCAAVSCWEAGQTQASIPQSVVMLQCAGTRDAAHSYCSRTCCVEALRGALALKQLAPSTDITILYRDIVTPGLDEALYEDARRQGIQFVRYTPDSPPLQEGTSLAVFDDVLREQVTLPADLLVLSGGIIPSPQTAGLAALLGVPLDDDGFFKPVNVKSQMMDLRYPGLFLAGLAGGPAALDETIAQGMGAALRAALFLRRKLAPLPAAATVNERICSGCGLCVQACPVGARHIDEVRAVAEVDPQLCLGCGTCVAVCPNGASSQALYETRGVLSMLDAALG